MHALLLAWRSCWRCSAFWLLRKGSRVVGGVALASALVVGFVYASTDTVPAQFTLATPYVTTLLVLSLASQRLRMPKADGQIYRKGRAK